MASTPPEQRRDSISPPSSVPAGFARLGEGDFHPRMAAAPGIAVAFFSAPRCGACRTWKRLLPEALAGIADAFFEIDVSEATGVARCFDIFHLPAVYLYRHGRFHAELQCEADANAMRRTALELLAADAQEEP